MADDREIIRERLKLLNSYTSDLRKLQDVDSVVLSILKERLGDFDAFAQVVLCYLKER